MTKQEAKWLEEYRVSKAQRKQREEEWSIFLGTHSSQNISCMVKPIQTIDSFFKYGNWWDKENLLKIWKQFREEFINYCETHIQNKDRGERGERILKQILEEIKEED